MKKKIATFTLCLFLAVGCATWQNMTTTEKLDLAGNYYEVFLSGLKMAAPLLSTDPKVAIALQLGDMALGTYKNIVAKYKEGTVGVETVSTADSTLYSAIVEANAIVGADLAK